MHWTFLKLWSNQFIHLIEHKLKKASGRIMQKNSITYVKM